MTQLDTKHIKTQVDDLLGKEVDRKEFLKHVGIGVIAMTGVLGVLKTLNLVGGSSSLAQGYGSSVYGGKKERS